MQFKIKTSNREDQEESHHQGKNQITNLAKCKYMTTNNKKKKLEKGDHRFKNSSIKKKIRTKIAQKVVRGEKRVQLTNKSNNFKLKTIG